MSAAELERAMVKRFGPDFRDKAIVTPLCVFRLRNAFDECGLRDPREPPASVAPYGVWQFNTAGLSRP